MIDSRNTQELIALRRLTVAVSKLLGEEVRAYLSTLAPLLRPRAVLGEYVQGSAKETARGADAAFKELQGLYASVAAAPPFNLPGELTPPVEVLSTALELTPFEYTQAVAAGEAEKRIAVTSPLKWVLSYSGFSLARLRQLVAARDHSSRELKEHLLHLLILHVVVSRQAGVARILETLHFPVKSETVAGLGRLPVTYVTSAVSTGLPPDAVIVESTEVSGRDVFEEVVEVDDILRLRDPLRDRLVELIDKQGGDLARRSQG